MPSSTEIPPALLELRKRMQDMQDKHPMANPLELVWLMEREHQVRLLTEALNRLSRNFLPAALAATGKLLLDWGLPDKSYGALVRSAWVGAEWPLQCLGLKQWQAMFRRVKWPSIMSSAELEEYRKLPDEVTIWRGVAGMGSHWRKQPHWSWTLDQDRAYWFANRLHRSRPMLMKATVHREEIYALLNDRGEQEVLLPFTSIARLHPITAWL